MYRIGLRAEFIKAMIIATLPTNGGTLIAKDLTTQRTWNGNVNTVKNVNNMPRVRIDFSCALMLFTLLFWVDNPEVVAGMAFWVDDPEVVSGMAFWVDRPEVVATMLFRVDDPEVVAMLFLVYNREVAAATIGPAKSLVRRIKRFVCCNGMTTLLEATLWFCRLRTRNVKIYKAVIITNVPAHRLVRRLATVNNSSPLYKLQKSQNNILSFVCKGVSDKMAIWHHMNVTQLDTKLPLFVEKYLVDVCFS